MSPYVTVNIPLELATAFLAVRTLVTRRVRRTRSRGWKRTPLTLIGFVPFRYRAGFETIVAQPPEPEANAHPTHKAMRAILRTVSLCVQSDICAAPSRLHRRACCRILVVVV